MISVILPVYNGEKYLREAIDSVLNQTFSEFELICINDGSCDTTEFILNEYSKVDSRVIVVSRDNKGLIYSLNEAISLSKYKYIARMDADDICHPERLMKQFLFLKKNPSISIVGSSYSLIDESGKKIGMRKPASYSFLIKSFLLFGSSFGHPTVMFNRDIMKEDLFYSSDYPAAEDYELWLRLSVSHSMANIPQSLLKYRVLSTSISRTQAYQQNNSKIRAMEKYLFYPSLTYEQIDDFHQGKIGKIRGVLTIINDVKSTFLSKIVQIAYYVLKK